VPHEGECEQEFLSRCTDDEALVAEFSDEKLRAAFLRGQFWLCLVLLESQAGRDLLPRFDRVGEFPCQLDAIHHCWLA
jgi:hypothetical protein